MHREDPDHAQSPTQPDGYPTSDAPPNRTRACPDAAFLPLATIRSYLPEMDRLGVSTVCRGPGGFLEAYCDAEGNPARLPPWWHARRAAFIARMHGQALLRGEPPRDERGRLTRRSLSLIAWAFDPELPGARRARMTADPPA